MEAAETRMNVSKDSVRAEDVGTLKGTLNVFVLLDLLEKAVTHVSEEFSLKGAKAKKLP